MTAAAAAAVSVSVSVPVSVVPDVTNRPLPIARAVLAAAGLSDVVVLYRESYEPRDTVVDQQPAPGHVVTTTAPAAITLWVARRGYLAHLPAIYQRGDAAGNHVTRAVCWVFEHLFDSVAARIDDGWQCYDPRVAPAELLDWLSGWTAFALDAGWSDAQRRTLLRRAVDLYRLRGTRRGLALFLALFTGLEPEIVEGAWPFAELRVAGEDATAGPRIGVDAIVLAPLPRAHCFVVTIPVALDAVAPELVARIHHIIAAEKPAHTHYCLRFAEAPFGVAARRDDFTIGVSRVDREQRQDRP